MTRTNITIGLFGFGVVGQGLHAVLARTPGLRARIEDVVVDEAARGAGVGAALTEEALRRARLAGVRTIELSSTQARAAAHRLYLRLGFQPQDSTVFRLTVD